MGQRGLFKLAGSRPTEAEGKPTLIMERMALVETTARWTGGQMLEASFARFRTLMAPFNVERFLSRSFCCWEIASMVETRGK